MTTLIDTDVIIYSTLVNAISVTNIVDNRIYNRFVPTGTVKPYVVFYLASGFTNSNTPVHDIDCVYRIEAVADSRSQAFDLHQAIYETLHMQTVSGLTGYSNYWLSASTVADLVDYNGGQLVWRKIQDYRLRLSTQ